MSQDLAINVETGWCRRSVTLPFAGKFERPRGHPGCRRRTVTGDRRRRGGRVAVGILGRDASRCSPRRPEGVVGDGGACRCRRRRNPRSSRGCCCRPGDRRSRCRRRRWRNPSTSRGTTPQSGVTLTRVKFGFGFVVAAGNGGQEPAEGPAAEASRRVSCVIFSPSGVAWRQERSHGSRNPVPDPSCLVASIYEARTAQARSPDNSPPRTTRSQRRARAKRTTNTKA